MRVYLKNRKGFIKYALTYGYTIRPVLVYNEHKGFSTLKLFLNFRLLLNKFKMPGVFYWGGWHGLFFPTNIELITIVGRGLKRKE